MNKFEERECVTFENKGQKIFGIFHKPITGAKHPLVVICHGLGGHKTGKYRMYVNLAEMLARSGISVFRFDYRGAGDSEGSFEEQTLGSQVSDTLEALKYVVRFKGIDSERIGLLGRSMGGAIAVLVAENFPKIKSMVLWAPVFNAEQWHEQWKLLNADSLEPEQREQIMTVNGQVVGYDFLQELFHMNLTDQFSKLSHIPILHIHGDKDEIVHTTHAEKYMAQRRDVITDTKFIRLPQSDHDFSFPPEQRFAIKETHQWFIKTLF